EGNTCRMNLSEPKTFVDFLAKSIIMLVVISVGIFFINLLGGSHTESVHEQATWKYWCALQSINQNAKPLEGQLKNVTSPEEMKLLMPKVATQARQMIKDIELLPVLNVDDELVQFAAETVKVDGEAASFAENFTDLMN